MGDPRAVVWVSQKSGRQCWLGSQEGGTQQQHHQCVVWQGSKKGEAECNSAGGLAALNSPSPTGTQFLKRKTHEQNFDPVEKTQKYIAIDLLSINGHQEARINEEGLVVMTVVRTLSFNNL